MIKAVFIDYAGTIITHGGKDIADFVRRICENSDMKNPREFVRYWGKMVKDYEESFEETAFVTEDDLVDKMLARCVEDLHLRENLEQLHILCQRFWMYAPLYDDVKDFFRNCPYPTYIVSNNGEKYIAEAMRVNELSPTGIVSSDTARAYKPHPAIFKKALEVSGCTADEVVHIGDSVSSDVKGAATVGIKPILLDRSGRYEAADVPVSKSLLEVLEMLR